MNSFETSLIAEFVSYCVFLSYAAGALRFQYTDKHRSMHSLSLQTNIDLAIYWNSFRKK